MKKKILGLVLIMALLVSVLSGCAKKVEPTPPVDSTIPTKDTISMAIPSDLNTLDPHSSNMIVDRVVRMNIFDPLLNFYEGVYEPTLIEKYELSEDGLNYTFHLKQGVMFHNGEELTAADVIFTMTKAKTSTVMASFTEIIKEVTASDKYTAVITLKAAYVPFIHAVAANVPIMNEKAVKDFGDDFGKNPVGTGPYKFSQWVAGEKVVLERFGDWHGGLAPIKTATFVFLTDPNSALMATETGEIDLTYTMPPIAVNSIISDGKLNLVKAPTLASGFLVFNLEDGPFTDKNFRLAVSHAVDKQEIIDVALEGLGSLSKGLWDERAGGFSGQFKPVEMDVALAKDYLAKSSYNGEEINFLIGFEYYRKVATLVAEQLRKVGIKAQVTVMEANSWLSEIRKGNYHMSTVNMSMEFDVEFWANAFHSRGIGGFNFARMSLPEVDNAFDVGKSTLDPAERKQVYSVIEKVLYEDASIVPHYFSVIPVAFSKSLQIGRFYSLGYARVIDMQWVK